MSTAGTPLPQSIIGSSCLSCLEPSPASTYGSSVASDSGDETPQTPNDDGVLLNKLGKLKIHDSKSKSIEHYSPPFVRNGVNSDDPFTATGSPPQSSNQHTPTGKSIGRASKSDNWRSDSSSSDPVSHSGSPLGIKSIRDAQRGSQRELFVQEFDSESSDVPSPGTMLVHSQDAQAIYPPSSCVFVANLLQSESDEALEVAVLEVFREFGTVFVKIRRDAKHMPFAFCQYTNDESAELAIKDGRGRLIKGRPCRCEKAKAHRLFFFERKYGAAITPDEVENLLRSFGKLTECRPATPLEMATNNLGEGVVVNFDMFDNGKNACQAFRNHAVYKMISLFHLGSPRNDRNQSDPARRAYLDTYEIDRRSIFVGNLPPDINELEVKDLFSKFGDIIHVAIHKSESVVDPCSKHCFAFVEFAQQPSVEKTIPELNGTIFRGKTLRVNQKDSETARSRSRRQLNPTQGPGNNTIYQTPTTAPQAPGSSMGCISPSPLGQTQFGNYSYPAGSYTNSFFVDARGQYWVTPTSPYTQTYPSSSPFHASPFQNAQYQTGPFYSGSPHGPHSYNWHQTPAPVWGAPGTTTAVPTFNPPGYSPPHTGVVSHNERSSRQKMNVNAVVESSMEPTK
ncbi:hypothetical protein K3495_g12408 [Podosphaera aphanis]|nr:hypothetical protein K3495_g12408 [Podosphaera aphanis]